MESSFGHHSRKMAAILHADVAGSTGLVQRDESLAHDRIKDAFNRFSTSIERYGGTVHEVRGDALVAEFSRASDAVCAALDFQKSHVHKLTQLDDDIAPTIRVGVSLGEVIFADGMVTGAGVVLAQRVEQLAGAGGVCITGAIHETLPQHMPFDQHDLGEQVAKGFSEPVRVYRVELREGAALPEPFVKSQAKKIATARWVTVTTAIFVICGGALLAWLQPWESYIEPDSLEEMAPSLPANRSIAVLPFTNMSNDEEQDYFVDGMTDDLITDLSKISGLFVISRNSVFTYQGESVSTRQVAEELGVRYVLEGSVRRTEDQVRINAQLIDAITGVSLWAERYDLKLSNVFAIQDEITTSIVQALEIRLTTQEKEALVANATVDFDAYDLFLRGLRKSREQSREAMSAAIGLYREAIKLDPGFSRAYGALAVALVFQYRLGWTESPLETMNLALEFAQKAVAISDKIPQVFWSLAYVQLFRNEYDDAVEAIQRAIEISPNYADAYGLQALIYNMQGNSSGAIESISRGMELNPYYSYDYPYNLGRAQYLAGKYEDAVVNLNKALEKNPTVPTPRIYLIASYVKQGMIDDAEWEVDQLQIQSPEMTISHYRRTSPLKDTLMDELALDLRKAGLPEE